MSRFDEKDLTRDVVLGGRLTLWQPRNGYRAGVDPLFLAAAVPARPGQRILELGCGVGAALLALGLRVPELELTGVELQEAYAALASRNADEAGLPAEVVNADLAHLPTELRQRQFDHVLANPPYFQPGSRLSAKDKGRETALGEVTPLETWIAVAAKRLAPKGYLHAIQRTDRLPDLLAACSGRLGSLEVLPLAARVGRAPEHVILRARKEGRAPFRLHAPMILHEGPIHRRDEEDYSAEISAVLRNLANIPWP